MPEQTRSYVAIDLKSFYASVECKERNLDPLTTNLVVADPERTTKTICLAVSPALKAYGIPGRARLFEVVRKVKEINGERKRKNGGHEFTGQSCDTGELKADQSFALDYITAVPRMALYMKYSTRIYDIYLKYVAPEDIHVYSIDEVFMDVTDYLHTYRLTPEELAGKIMREIYEQTRITATAGIGTNLYLAKIAMDIMAKHSEPDENGFRFASLDVIADLCGITDRLRIFGVWEEAMRKSWNNVDCIPWEILPDARLEKRMNFITKSFCIKCSV